MQLLLGRNHVERDKFLLTVTSNYYFGSLFLGLLLTCYLLAILNDSINIILELLWL
jgi:hypothetical protein